MVPLWLSYNDVWFSIHGLRESEGWGRVRLKESEVERVRLREWGWESEAGRVRLREWGCASEGAERVKLREWGWENQAVRVRLRKRCCESEADRLRLTEWGWESEAERMRLRGWGWESEAAKQPRWVTTNYVFEQLNWSDRVPVESMPKWSDAFT